MKRDKELDMIKTLLNLDIKSYGIIKNNTGKILWKHGN